MSKKIGLVGHCGPDSGFLRMAVSSAQRGLVVVGADDEQELQHLLKTGVDLLLINRQLDWGFDEHEGIALIRQVHAHHPTVKCMLVSNYAEAQAAAVAAGALPGFGKREIGTPRVATLLREALEGSTTAPAAAKVQP